MSEFIRTTSTFEILDADLTLNPVIGNMAQELQATVKKTGGRLAKTSWELIEQMLSYAAQAEQRLVEQNEQISEQNRRIRTLETLSTTDDLTGLLNRRGFIEVLERTLNDARRHNERGLLAYLDLKKFKHTNDKFGHAAGDTVLAAVGRFLTSNTRKTDYAARLGGDEFAVLFVRANPTVATARAAALRRELHMERAIHEGVELEIHASLGLADYNAESEAEELLREADRAMYRDKHGKGHVPDFAAAD